MTEAVLTERQLPLTGLQLRDQGITSLERHNPAWLERARLVAAEFCRDFGWTSTDSLHHVMGPPPHLNCWGAVFHDKRFKWTGQYVKSKRPEAHYRDIKVWRLR